ncbi:uncharacterized protein LOC131680906 [Topomyia yanbarensis]|uniref:uncharacterized protein LOC131680906 n=1 Tax=Topomyia yanbarensis TaxID=2498891 RepID=UPI00273B10A2|nr:uncharacterized protein LOC131680906 [Topomyia yanbarensis]
MDRSVDSIGSCSLDVDADSTDFSDTSGELNFLTPSSAKDIQREFTAGIKERCKIPVINCQAVTTVLDPVTGNISTVLTTTSPQTETATTAVSSKKPSYLNLACCVNGYSNLTTYDSKLRQDINKSREVSPSRPIIATLHYNRSDGGNFQLTAPTLSYISMNNSINNNISNGRMGGMVNGAGRYGGAGVVGGQDVTDNASMFNGNGFGGGLKTNVISSQSQISSVRESEKVVKKSFIQQRVEKLYGNAEGVVISKQIYNSNERKYLNNIANENVSKNYCNAILMNGNGSVAAGVGGAAGGGVSCAGGGGGVGGYGGLGSKENLDENNKEIDDDPDMEALPVLRHLRPEFRAQLQLFSPKKVLKTSPNRSVVGSNGTGGSLNGNNGHIMSNGSELSHQHLHSALLSSKGKVASNGTTTKTLSSSSAPTIHTSSSVQLAAAGTVGVEKRIESESDLLSVVTSSTVTSNHCDEGSVPTTAANNNIARAAAAARESRSPITIAKVSVTEQTATEKDPVYAEESNLALENNQPQKMKLNHPAVVTVNGDGSDNGTIVRNGTSGKNGHYHTVVAEPNEEKENLNGTVLEVTLSKTQLKDGNYFLQVLKNEQNRILAMAAEVEREAEALKADGIEISEEIAGYVLVAAGKARLLCTQKMKQFEGLCYNNLNQSPDEKFQTTNEDLRGFWDMLLLQVDKVDASFREIDTFRRNGWKEPTHQSPVPQARSTKLVKRPFKSSATSASAAATNGCGGSTNGTSNSTKSSAAAAAADAKKAAAAKRDAQRKQLMEMKRKQKLTSTQQNVEIFVPGTSPAVVTNACESTNGAAAVDAS